MVNCSHCGKELSEPLPNFCPDCGKSTIIALNKPQETSRSRENLSIGSLKLLYGKTTLDIGKIKTVGKFTLNEPVNVTYNAAYLYGFNAYKSVTRGNQSIYADEFGYILLSPKDKTVFGLPHAKKGYPKSKDIKDDLDSEYIRIFEDKVAEDDERYLSLIKNLELPELFPPESLTKSLISIVAKNLVVRETYYVQSKKKYDSGARNIDIKFKNQDIRNVQFLGGVAIPMVELYYQHPESDKIVRKKIMAILRELC
jgi:hypothetical protein